MVDGVKEAVGLGVAEWVEVDVEEGVALAVAVGGTGVRV